MTCCISHVHESRNDWFKKRSRSRRGDKKKKPWKVHYVPFRVGRPLRQNSEGFERNRRCIVFRHATYENEYTLLTIMMKMMMMMMVVVVVVSRWLWRCLLKLWIIVRLEAVSRYRLKISVLSCHLILLKAYILGSLSSLISTYRITWSYMPHGLF